MDRQLGAILVKRVLMVAYHFPPINVSSGIQRTLRFAQYLPEFEWEPAVLTVHPRAYPSTSQASLAEVPPDLNVRRAFALDAAKHLSLRGAYPRILALPDRWWSWWLGALPAGLALIRKLKPEVLWSTYPIATAHLIAYTLHRLTGIRWVADFRDPMIEPDYRAPELEHRAMQWIEAQTMKHCKRAVFTAAGALRLCAERYGKSAESRMTVIENGFDELAFTDAEKSVNHSPTAGRPLLIVHSGTIYASARDPRPLFSALSELLQSGRLGPHELRLVLRATGDDQYIGSLVEAAGIGNIVSLQPSVPYRVALAEMMSADGLLLLQAANCNYQIPAKLYEYLRAGRPILALTDPQGDTAGVLRRACVDTIAPLDSKEQIAQAVLRFTTLLREGRAPMPSAKEIHESSRRARTAELAHQFEQVAAAPA